MKSISTSFRLAPKRGHGFTLIELLVVIGILALLAALLLPLFGRAKVSVRNATCVSQLRQLAIATRFYADDNDSRLPVAERLPSLPAFPDRMLARICDALGPYAGKTASTNSGVPVFKCPSDRQLFFEVEGSSYMWNVALNGKRIDAGDTLRIVVAGPNTRLDTNITRNAESIPLLFDYDDFHPRPPKSGKNAVFMDGHVAPPEIVLSN